MRRWLSRTETLISWAETTRKDWDRHLRPMLARQFEMASGQRKVKDRGHSRHGQMLFGPEPWAWVDPETSPNGMEEPGPGREALTAGWSGVRGGGGLWTEHAEAAM